MGSREAQAYLASPEVVATSAITGYISGARHFDDVRPEYGFSEFEPPVPDESVEIVAGFPERIQGRLVFVPHDNINTDGIYGKDFTYREDLTPAEMASVVMQNYDPEFAQFTRSGDVLVAGRNFGTGSSREQAATALQHKGIALVIAASFSQTYLRNAYNNGFICIECPSLVDDLNNHFKKEIESGYLTIISSDPIAIEFGPGVVAFDGREYRFRPLGPVPQSLIAAGGVERKLTKRKDNP
jgi:homoaconitate hydratase